MPNDSRPAAAVPAVILAIETATSVARVVVVDGRSGARLAGAEAVSERHSSNLLRLCVETTSQAGVSVRELGAIACGAGPGSFTGLRVGFAVAKGLAMPRDIPLVLVSSLEALAIDMCGAGGGAVRDGALLLPCLDAGKGQIFAALYRPRADGTVALSSEEWSVIPQMLPGQLPDEESILCAGPGAVRYWRELSDGLGGRGRLLDVAGPSADAVARRGLARLALGERDDLGTAAPSYGRAPDITQSKRAGR